MNRELIAIIHPDDFELDFHETTEQLEESQANLQQKLYDMFKENPYQLLYDIGFSNKHESMSESVRFLGVLSSAFIKSLSQKTDVETLRNKIVVEPRSNEIEYIISMIPYMTGGHYIDENWIKLIWSILNQIFSKEIEAFKGSVEEYFTSKDSTIHPVGRVFFHLVENKKDSYPFAFLATYTSDTSDASKSKHLPLKNSLEEYKDDNKKLLKLLSTVSRASEKSSLISELLDTGDIFHPIGLSLEEAYTFLKEVGQYEDAGILCRIPDWWRRRSNSLKVSLTIGDKAPSIVGFDAIIDFNAELALGGQTLSVEEVKQLLSESEGLTLIKGKWVEVNHAKLKQALEAYEQASKVAGETGLTMIEAMRLHLNASKVLNVSQEDMELEVTNGQWIDTVFRQMVKLDNTESVGVGESFKAALRDYQKKGLTWLYYMKSLGLGACLADDMGLGKTVQVLALLNNILSVKREKILLVVPASLIGNWTNEIIRFAPSLNYHVLHPSENKSSGENDRLLLETKDVFITTYGMLSKYDWIKDVMWDILILDEAQAIKNPGTNQTKVVKKIKAAYKVAMTGTPIENRLSDLWSLFDFLNKGLLGTRKEFADFIKNLDTNHDGYKRLKKVVSPFILRRLKTDKSVIKDLPDKIEMKTYSNLSKKQATLYHSLVDELKTKLESSSEGIERKGLVLSSIMKFKQICNHPDQYLGQDSYDEADSGKYKVLREICETIYEKRERVLIFTQFKSITEHLKNFLETIFEHEGLVLHGETPVTKRQNIVERFQGKEYVPFLVLSLKAGGVGLNLTNANHVIHFDRWWNPAVENQATDRAFRIGQKKNVIVHKFITKGTIEEKIDLMIEDKVKLQSEIVSSNQESLITEMDNKELLELFKLTI